ncbi:winged helix-turn-helix transcriptional regulator [Candidatus Pacearchaeota archaeon]|nr:winged helix-turn-helix transcriptional regulator [Candidatus Pacearchaeota archaeon]
MKLRKKDVLDGIDREILRVLLKRRPLVSRQIASKVGLTPSAISPRLMNLKKKGILKPAKILGLRNFKRNFKNKIQKIKSPRSIYWDLDLKNEN